MFLTRNSSYSAAFSNENDDLSLQFSIDPDMYRKLGIKKAKRGEESSFDINKIYEFQLQRDIAKIKQSRGTYKERNNAFLHTRDKDPFYHELAKKSDLAIDGKFNELLEYTAEPSWKETSQPYGEIAHKRYIEYLNSIPPGPTPEMIQDVDQREQDNKLWKDIK